MPARHAGHGQPSMPARDFGSRVASAAISQCSHFRDGQVRTTTVDWIEAVYNLQCRHSAIDMLTPVDYEERFWNRRAAASLRCFAGRGKTSVGMASSSRGRNLQDHARTSICERQSSRPESTRRYREPEAGRWQYCW